MEVGFYGKLPSHGDFLRRRASDNFLSVWDPWLQQCLAASRESLGDRWLDFYLTSPAWRFVAAPGACGDVGLLGLVVPSVDRVGRYFPLTLIAELPPHLGPLSAATASEDFFDRAERLIVETLDADVVDFERFDQLVVQLADHLVPLTVPRDVNVQPEAAAVLTATASRWHVALGGGQHLPGVFEQLLGVALEQIYDPLTLWWTQGSAVVEPSCLIVKGLPPPSSFAALLSGDWTEHRWPSADVRVSRERTTEVAARADENRLAYRSAAASSAGRVRRINQDCFIEHPQSGLWAVADGVGGHRDGDAASRMVCDAFADFLQTGSFDDTIQAVGDRMGEVNTQLVRSTAASLRGDASSSTVVVLLVRGSRCAVLWAGDSRAYRWRDGRFIQLTRDHSVDQSGGESHAITRAVGAQRQLELDVLRDEVRPGDRFLLCSDGLTRVLTDARLGAALDGQDPAAAVQLLIQATLEGGAPDNVTALIVEATVEAAAKES